MTHDDDNVTSAVFGDQAPDPDVFLESVLDGWARQQRAKDFAAATIGTRRKAVLNLVDFSGHYPWEWTLADADDFFSHARAVRNLSHGTVRSYQGAIKLFCDFACDPRYDWSDLSTTQFGRVFAQVVTELNRVTHSEPTEARPAKRPFTQQELQALFWPTSRSSESWTPAAKEPWQRGAMPSRSRPLTAGDSGRMSCAISRWWTSPATAGPPISATMASYACAGESRTAALRRRCAPC